jgi:hypothetical protein
MKKELFNVGFCLLFVLGLTFVLPLFGNSFSEVLEWMKTLLTTSRGWVFLLISTAVVYGLFLLLRYFIRIYQREGAKALVNRLITRLIVPVGGVVLLLYGAYRINTAEDFEYDWNTAVENSTGSPLNRQAQDGKLRGMTVYRLGRNRGRELDNLIRHNVEWVAVFPYLSQQNEASVQINARKTYEVWSAQDSAHIRTIKAARKKKLKVMLKPHIWLMEGWRANIELENEEEWEKWFASYRKEILHYAAMAALTAVELFCIGTELRSSIKTQPEAWIALVQEVRKIYSGKLTYAANWDREYREVGFWNELDYVGIQGYFPLTTRENPSIELIRKGWQKHIKNLSAFSQDQDKPVLFTEIGYRNEPSATVKPWEWSSSLSSFYSKKSDRTQYYAYEALFAELWHQNWFAGLFAWQWTSGDFPIKNKPAANAIAKWYGLLAEPSLELPQTSLGEEQNP